jgi:hypothetical protein
MSDSRKTRVLVNKLRDVDDIFHIITGTRISNVVARGLSIFGPELVKKITGESADRHDPASPYDILEVRRGASLNIVKAAFRSKAREYHPDTGVHPDAAAFQAAQEAYNRIREERKQESGS